MWRTTVTTCVTIESEDFNGCEVAGDGALRYCHSHNILQYRLIKVQILSRSSWLACVSIQE